MRKRNIHYLRRNERVYVPQRVMCFDTESSLRDAGGVEVHTLRLWAAEVITRDDTGAGHHKITTHTGKTSEELADLIDIQAKKGKTLWVYAHNLSFDLSITHLPVLLIERGWKLTQHGLAADAPWARFARGEHHIVLADAFSLLPTSLDTIGKMVDMDKPTLPAWDDDDDAWYKRCQADVAILRTAILQMMDWWQREQLGNWSITGPSCGWNAYRHMPSQVKVTIKPDDEAIRFERMAITAGRREVWYTGDLPSGSYADIDFVHAHLTVCTHMRLPHRRYHRFDSLPLDSIYLRSLAYDVIAEVELSTSTPRYPVRVKSGIFYPIGRFKTVLCGPEIREASQRGELVSIGRGYVYGMAHTMRTWGMWMTQRMEHPPPDQPAVAAVTLKGWSRTVPGRWAMRTSKLVRTLPDPRPGWIVEDGWIMPDNVPAKYITLCGTQYTYALDQEGDDSFPAVLAFIQSWTRVLLGRLIDALQPHVLQANTDGCLINAAGLSAGTGRRKSLGEDGLLDIMVDVDAALEYHARGIAPIKARVKRYAKSGAIIGPQHVKLDEEQRFSGIPANAKEIDRNKYVYTVWPKLTTQLSRLGKPGYIQQRGMADLSKVPVNRWRLKDGRCEPVEMRVDEHGDNVIVPPHIQWIYDGILEDIEKQHPDLRDAIRLSVNYHDT